MQDWFPAVVFGVGGTQFVNAEALPAKANDPTPRAPAAASTNATRFLVRISNLLLVGAASRPSPPCTQAGVEPANRSYPEI